MKVGITGGIGAGKSTVSGIFKILGIPVYDADQRAKELMNENTDIIDAVSKLFGEQAYADGKLNRDYLAKVAFNDPDKLKELNTIVHPAVSKDYELWVRKQHDAAYTLKEAALLYESGSYKSLDKIILVSAPENLRIERVLKRDQHRSQEDVKKIIQRQWAEDKKQEMADFIVWNDESSLVIPQVLAIHQVLS